jgi:signal transduction histidine kinase
MAAGTGERDGRQAVSDASDPAWRSDPRFRTALEAMIDGVVIYSSIRDSRGVIVDFRCEYANESIVKNGGLPPREQVGRTMLETWPHVGDPEIFSLYRRVVETGEPLVREVPWFEDRRVSGSFEIQAARLDDGIVLVLRDTTERTNTEAELRASEQRLETFIQAIPAGIVVADWQGPVFMNVAAHELLGRGLVREHSPEDLPAIYNLYRAGTDELYPVEEMPLRRALIEERTVSASDIVIRRPDGDVPVDSFATPLRDERGEIYSTIAVITDATERRARAAELADAHAALESAHEELSEFAAHAAHDLAEPLRGVAGFAEVLRDRHGENLGDEGRMWLDLMIDGTVRMRALIDELLVLAQAGSQPFRHEPVALDDLVRRIRDGLCAAHDDPSTLRTAGLLPVVLGDERQLLRVLQNLVGNALKFRRPDVAPVVVVDAERLGSVWEVRVTDNGIGVPPDQRERIFEPFHRLAGEAESGAGLGLAICRRIVERHGGTIRVESADDGIGSRFCFTLPSA